MNANEWIEVNGAAELPCGRGRFVFTDSGGIALFHVEPGTFLAVADSCPHNGASLAGGMLQGRVVRCRAHGLEFDLATGCSRSGPGLRVARHEVRTVDGRVLVRRAPSADD